MYIRLYSFACQKRKKDENFQGEGGGGKFNKGLAKIIYSCIHLHVKIKNDQHCSKKGIEASWFYVPVHGNILN